MLMRSLQEQQQTGAAAQASKALGMLSRSQIAQFWVCVCGLARVSVADCIVSRVVPDPTTLALVLPPKQKPMRETENATLHRTCISSVLLF